ncbi:MAG: Hsp20/alpha crystallin family protein [Patescibacteria group bacterium]|nr:Hsp20/alpha crystallin family protein [Patescibacteria group bacterium]
MLPRLWDPFDDMDNMVRNFPALTNNNDFNRKGFVPAVDVYETKDAVVVETLLPGVNPEQVEVSVEKGVLTIQGESQREHEIDEKNYYRKEVRGGSFFRQVSLPVSVKENEVSAEFEDGILKITCPKAEEKKMNKVDVKVIKK